MDINVNNEKGVEFVGRVEPVPDEPGHRALPTKLVFDSYSREKALVGGEAHPNPGKSEWAIRRVVLSPVKGKLPDFCGFLHQRGKAAIATVRDPKNERVSGYLCTTAC